MEYKSQLFCDCEICVLSRTNRIAYAVARKMLKEDMDKKIKKLQSATKKVVKEEASLLKADKKNDKVIDKAKKVMKKGKC